MVGHFGSGGNWHAVGVGGRYGNLSRFGSSNGSKVGLYFWMTVKCGVNLLLA